MFEGVTTLGHTDDEIHSRLLDSTDYWTRLYNEMGHFFRFAPMNLGFSQKQWANHLVTALASLDMKPFRKDWERFSISSPEDPNTWYLQVSI